MNRLALLKPRLDREAVLVLLVAAILGCCYAFLTPPLRVADEASHFYRSYTVSTGHCTGVPAILLPTDWNDMDKQEIWRMMPDLTPSALVDLGRSPGITFGSAGAFSVGNVYPCLLYVPGAVGMAVARPFSLSPLARMYAGRLSNLLFFLCLLAVSLAILPAYWMEIAAVALMPMSLHQAGSLSSDGPVFGLALVFCAYVLKLAAADDPRPLNRTQKLLLIFLVAMLAISKMLIYMGLLLLLIPQSRFRTGARKWIFIGACATAGGAMIFLWNLASAENWNRLVALRTANGIDMRANSDFIVQHPIVFFEWVMRSLELNGWRYANGIVGRLGWDLLPLPGWVAAGYFMTLLLLAISARRALRIGIGGRLVLASLFLMNLVSIFAVVWVFEISTAGIAGNGTISGVQGRYFVPFMFPLVAAVSVNWLPQGQWRKSLLVCAVLIANGMGIREIWNEHYARTSTLANRVLAFASLSGDGLAPHRLYGGKLVRRPGPTPEDGKVYYVDNGKRRWVFSAEVLRRLGLRFPEDVILISADELARIPEGAPLN